MKQVLIADDDKDLANSIGDLLDDMGFESLVAENGADALSLYEENKSSISLIISDVRMPQIDGIDLLKEIKKRDGNQKFLFVFMSGFSDFSKQELIDMGALDVLVKPLDYDRLETILDSV